MSRYEQSSSSGSSSEAVAVAAAAAGSERLQQGLVQQLQQLERARREQQTALAEAGRSSSSSSNGVARDEALRSKLRPLVQLEQRAATAAIELVDRMLAQLADAPSRDVPSDGDDFEDYRAKRRRTDHAADRPRAGVAVDRQRSRDRTGAEAAAADAARSRGRDARDRSRGRDTRDRSRGRDSRDRSRRRSRDRSYERSSGGGGSDRRVRRHDSGGGGGGSGAHRSARDDEGGRSGRAAVVARGSLVAARVPTAEQAEEWILATVLSYSAEKNRYTVQDYELESAERPTYTLSPRLVLYVTEPLGAATGGSGGRRRSLWDRTARPELGRGVRLLALYPGTTVFYICTVVVPPSLNTALSGVILPPVRGVPMGPPDVGPAAPPDPLANPMYRVQFDDDGDRQVNIPAHLVVPLPRSGSTNGGGGGGSGGHSNA